MKKSIKISCEKLRFFEKYFFIAYVIGQKTVDNCETIEFSQKCYSFNAI